MSRSRLAFLNIAAAVVGVALLIFTVQRAGGWGAIVAGVTSIGWWFVVVLLLGAFRMVCRTRAWMICVDEPATFRFRDAFAAWMAGDAVGNLTPLGLLASEPTKILMVRARISTVTSIASVAIENLFYTASVIAVLLTGTWLLLQRANVPDGLERAAEIGLAAIVVVSLIGIWAARARPAIVSRFGPLISKVAGRADAPAEAMRDVEARVYAVPQWPLARIARVAAWEVAFHIAAIAEVWVVLASLLPTVTLTEAFLLESAGRFVTVAFKFVPYRLGIDEVGSGAVAGVLGLPPATGVTLALIRRLRIICLNTVGLLALARK